MGLPFQAVDLLDEGTANPSQLSIAIQRARRAARKAETRRQTEERLRRLTEKP